MRKKKMKLDSRQILAVGALFVLVVAVGCTSVDGVTTRACDVTTVPVNSGFDHSESGAFEPHSYSPGAADGKWIVISDPIPDTQEPRSASVVNTSSTSWADPMPNSQWVAPYPEGTIQPRRIPAGRYEYLSCFCLCNKGQQEIGYLAGAKVRVDNVAEIYLNDVLIGNALENYRASTSPADLTVPDPNPIHAGINCLKVVVTNKDNPSATGFNIVGTLGKITCCEGAIDRPDPNPAMPDPLLIPVPWKN